MSLEHDLERLRQAIIEGDPDDDAITTVTVELAKPVGLSDLEALLGEGRPLPRRPSGGAHQMLFPDTVPAEGNVGATVIAELEGNDVARITLRRDDLR